MTTDLLIRKFVIDLIAYLIYNLYYFINVLVMSIVGKFFPPDQDPVPNHTLHVFVISLVIFGNCPPGFVIHDSFMASFP